MNDDEPIRFDRVVRVSGTVEFEADAATFARLVEWACAPIIANVFGGPLDGLDVVLNNEEDHDRSAGEDVTLQSHEADPPGRADQRCNCGKPGSGAHHPSCPRRHRPMPTTPNPWDGQT